MEVIIINVILLIFIFLILTCMLLVCWRHISPIRRFIAILITLLGITTFSISGSLYFKSIETLKLIQFFENQDATSDEFKNSIECIANRYNYVSYTVTDEDSYKSFHIIINPRLFNYFYSYAEYSFLIED